VDGELDVWGGQHDDLERVAGAVGADDEPAVRVFAGVFDEQRMVDSVVDVVSATPCLRADSWITTADIVLRKDRHQLKVVACSCRLLARVSCAGERTRLRMRHRLGREP
jgi:hypothetical protein